MAFGGNPVFNNNKSFRSQPAGRASTGSATMANQTQLSSEQLQELYNQPSAGPVKTGRMTYDDVIVKTIGCLAVLIGGAIVGAMFPVLMWVGMIGGLILGLVNAFKKEPSPALILAFAVLEGMFVGGLSGILESIYPGIVFQAVLGTLVVFGVTFALFKSGKVRASPKAMKFFMIAITAYALFSLINFGLVMFGVVDQPFGLRTSVEIFGIPLGVFIGILAIGLAAFSLIIDFTAIEQGVRNGVPQKYSWTAAFGLTVTLVWLYVEILRLLAILRGSD